MKLKIYSILMFFILGLNFNLTYAGGIEEDETVEESKDYENVELTTREDISEFQESQEPLYEKLEEITADGCDGEVNVIKWSKGCVTWSGGYLDEGEKPDTYVRYGS